MVRQGLDGQRVPGGSSVRILFVSRPGDLSPALPSPALLLAHLEAWPERSAEAVVRMMGETFPRAALVAWTDHPDAQRVAACLRAGARACLARAGMSYADLLTILGDVAAGSLRLCPMARQALTAGASQREPCALTPAQMRAVRALYEADRMRASGSACRKEVARALRVRPSTLYNLVYQAADRLGVDRSVEAVVQYCLQQGIIGRL